MNVESESAYDSQREKWRSADVKTAENVDFSTLLLPDRIQLGLKNCGFEKPSPVQLQAIPLGRCGIDLVVQAKSGTGKTCVMAVIALDSLVVDSPNTQVLILAPTREIASQICGVVRDLGFAFPDLTCETFIGGLPLRSDKAKLPCCQIVVGTPGRIKQLIDMEILQTESIRLFVVDEADRLFDKQFKEDINWIFSSLPSRKQILALSATYPDELSKFLSLYMETPVYIRINSRDPALLGITQCFRSTPYHPMLQVTDSAKFNILLDILNSITFSQCMIFCQRQTKAQDLADNLVLKGFPSLAICSALDQVRRLEVIHDLKSFQCRVLVSTDLTARGIDAENVDLVINFETPYEPETYLHRIGRAGRYGTRGMSISLVSDGDELKRLKTFQKKFLFKIYELPDPIPVNLWDKLVTLQVIEPEGIENGHLSNSNGFDSTCDSTALESTHENEPKQCISEKYSDTVTDEPEGDVPGAVCCSNNTVETHQTEVLNGCVASDNSEKTGVIVSETKQLVSSGEKACEIKVANPDNSTSVDQMDIEKQSEVQDTSQEMNLTESKMESNGDMEENTHVEMVTLKSIDNDSVMCVPKEANAVAPSSVKMDGIVEGNSASSVKLDLCNSVDLDLSKEEDLNKSGIEIRVEKNVARGHDELVKTDSPIRMDLKESEKSESTKAKEEQVMKSKVASCSLFQKWEKYLHSNEENTSFSNKDVSDILVPVLGTNETGDSKSNLSYSELVQSWECRNDHSVTDSIEHCPVTSVSDSRNIPQAQMEVIEKYIWQDKCQFFSAVQTIFEMESDPVSCERKASVEPPSNASMSEENLNTSKLPNEDDQLESKSANISQNENIPYETADLEQVDELLKNASISVITATDGQNCCGINSSEKENQNEVAKCVDTSQAPDTDATNPCTEADGTLSNRFLPFHSNKSVGQVEEGLSTDKCNGNHLTEAVYDSVTCGMKYSTIVSLPSVPSDPPKKNSSVNGKDSVSANISNQKPMVQNQGVKKKVCGTRKTEKYKQKCQEIPLNSAQVSSFEQSVADTGDVVEGNDLSFRAYQETETGQSGKNVIFASASVSHRVSEQRVGRKKRGNMTPAKQRQKNKHGFSDGYENATDSGNGYWNPPGFTNNGVCSPCVSFAPHYICCCRLPHIQQSDSCFQSPVPFQNIYPQYYYKKFLEQWYYIQELTHSYRRYPYHHY